MIQKIRHVLFLMGLPLLLFACSNSEPNSNTISADFSSESPLNTISDIKTYLPLNDTEYPYAGIPRIVIETNNRQKIKDVESKISARLQVWGEKEPKTKVMNLTIRGRGNSSWTDSPKKSYKIELEQKQELLGMPRNRDWALISNFFDKSLMKNYLMYNFSRRLNAYYSPRCEFVELFLNDEYLGVYLLTETIKIGQNRVDIPDRSTSYIVEFDIHLREGEQVVYSNVIPVNQYKNGTPFRIHNPKNATEAELNLIKEEITSFENFLIGIKENENNNVEEWIDVEECVKHYWVQEFSKNPDAWFHTSVFFSWVEGEPIKMGPVWDFDLSFGGFPNELPYREYSSVNRLNPDGWYINYFYWNRYLFKDSVVTARSKDFWLENKDVFRGVLKSIDSIAVLLYPATINNFRRWKILKSTDNKYHTKAFSSYEDAVECLKDWAQKRLVWIDKQFSE